MWPKAKDMRTGQLPLLVLPRERPLVAALNERRSTFVDNMAMPIHRWFRYSAGFSAAWVEHEVRAALEHGPVTLLDPFAGAGTTLVEGERCAVATVGVEAHPFVSRVARAKLGWRQPVGEFLEYAGELFARAHRHGGEALGYPRLIEQCYPPSVLADLDALRRGWESLPHESEVAELAWLAITAILRVCSPVGTAQWQYVLPRKEKASSLSPFAAYQLQVQNMAADMRLRQSEALELPAVLPPVLHVDDARTCGSVPNRWASLVLTSPPYTNNYDYADATRLEMSFWGEVQSWRDLHQRVRRHLIRSCSQHVDADREQLDCLLRDPDLVPVVNEIAPVCDKLARERLQHGGKKSYHLMVAAYFGDLAKVWKALRRAMKEGSRACFVVGDSAPYGVYVPVDRWLGDLAVAAGFKSYSFHKTRDRNVKWKNRKHRVPLHEGCLWVEG